MKVVKKETNIRGKIYEKEDNRNDGEMIQISQIIDLDEGIPTIVPINLAPRTIPPVQNYHQQTQQQTQKQEEYKTWKNLKDDNNFKDKRL